MITTRRITGKSIAGEIVTGNILLVFKDALVSGTKEFVSVTYLLVEDDNGKTHTVRPREVSAIIKPEIKENF